MKYQITVEGFQDGKKATVNHNQVVELGKAMARVTALRSEGLKAAVVEIATGHTVF